MCQRRVLLNGRDKLLSSAGRTRHTHTHSDPDISSYRSAEHEQDIRKDVSLRRYWPLVPKSTTSPDKGIFFSKSPFGNQNDHTHTHTPVYAATFDDSWLLHPVFRFRFSMDSL